jgi:nucleoside-diphosphate-sugar epimerase
VNLRFFTVYGPRQRPDLAIHKFVKQMLAGEPVILFGDGETARDYTYIEDILSGVYNALLYCLNNENVYQTVNLGNSSPVKLKDLVAELYKATGTEQNIKYDSMQPGDVDITFADIDAAKRLFAYQPVTKISAGLHKFIDWYKASHTW